MSRLRAGATHEVLVRMEKESAVVYIPDHAYHRLELDKRDYVKIGFKKNKVRVFCKSD